MNIAFLLTPKSEVATLKHTSTLRQAFEKMEYHRYSQMPILDDEGRYIGTLSEGDIAWRLKADQLDQEKPIEKIRIGEIDRHFDNNIISINADFETALMLSIYQNFLPVIDDQGVFIGIIKRSDIITYCYSLIYNDQPKSRKRTPYQLGENT